MLHRFEVLRHVKLGFFRFLPGVRQKPQTCIPCHELEKKIAGGGKTTLSLCQSRTDWVAFSIKLCPKPNSTINMPDQLELDEGVFWMTRLQPIEDQTETSCHEVFIDVSAATTPSARSQQFRCKFSVFKTTTLYVAWLLK